MELRARREEAVTASGAHVAEAPAGDAAIPGPDAYSTSLVGASRPSLCVLHSLLLYIGSGRSGGGGTSGTAQPAVPLPTPPPPLRCRSISVLPTPTPSACAALRSSASPNAGRSRRLLCARHPQRLAHLYTPSSPPSSPPPPCDTASLPTPGQSPLARGGHPRAACPPWLLYLARVVRGSGSSSSSSSSSGSSSGTCAVGSTCRCATGAGGSFAHVHRQLRQTIRIYTYSHFTPNMYNLHGYLLLLR